MDEMWENLKNDVNETKDKIMNTVQFSGFGGSSSSMSTGSKYGTSDLLMYIISVAISIMLIQKIVPMNNSNPAYVKLRICLYVIAVLGGGYPLFFLIVLYFLKVQFTIAPGS
jgi:hypothetical protein